MTKPNGQPCHNCGLPVRIPKGRDICLHCLTYRLTSLVNMMSKRDKQRLMAPYANQREQRG